MSENTMICYCKGVTLEKVLAAIDNGAKTVAEVIDITGAGSGCGRCVDRIEAVIEEKK